MHAEQTTITGRHAGTSAHMLRSVLDGATYDAVATDFGVTRTAVERRVKSLAGRLCREVGISGMTEGSTAFVGRLRAARAQVLAALDAYCPSTALPPRNWRVVSAEEVVAGTVRIRGRSPEPRRDVALFCLLFATGARPLEIARLSVGDYLCADGTVRRCSELSAQASISGRARPLYFASERLDEALAHYLRQRVERGHGVGASAGMYRGLDPTSRLFLTSVGDAFRISHPREGNLRRSLCRPLLEVYGKLFRYAGIPGANVLSVRRTVAAWLFDRGAEVDQVGQFLGISDHRAVRALCPRQRRDLAGLVEDLV
jgi:integrase